MATAFISSLAHGSPYGSSLFGYPSYWDVTLTGSDYFSGTYDAWCVNPTQFLTPSNTGYVELYPTYLPSSGYTQPNSLIPASVFSRSNYTSAAAIAQLDNVNWLLNQHFTGNPQFSVSEVQIAIWRLLGFSTGTQYLQSSDWQEADVQSLVTQASSAAADSFVPGDDDVFAVIAAPTFNVGGGPAQPILIETRFAKLGDRVWLDANANGVQDTGEAGVAGVTVQLSGTDAFGQAVTRTTTTASDNPATTGVDEAGSYLFSRLVPGTYTVTFVLPSGYSFTTQLNPGNADGIANDSDANAATGVTSAVILSSGEIERDVDAGIYRTASLGDRLWIDTNGDGLQNDGATGISGQVVTLIGGGADGVIGTADDTTATTTTGTDGLYQFTGLTPGVQYQVQFSKPAGTVFTTQDASGNTQDALDSDANPTTGKTQIVTLASGENNTTLDAGVYVPAKIGDRVWLDANANGQQDAGEAGVPNVAVQLYTCVNNQPGALVASTTTDANGLYGFSGLKPGDYLVKFITPAGYSLSPVNVGADATDSDAALSGFTGCYTLASGETNTTVDAGIYAAATIDLIKTIRADHVACPSGPIGGGNDGSPAPGVQPVAGIDLGGLTDFLFFFGNGSSDANWQGATKGFAGNVAIDGLQAKERTSGGVPFAGTIYTNDSSLGAWQNIVDQNVGQASGVTGQTALISGLKTDLVDAFLQINALSATQTSTIGGKAYNFANISSSALNGLNTQDGIAQTFVINVTSGFNISSKINITGDAGDVFVLRWDSDANSSNGYQGQVKFQSGGAIVPLGGLQAGNFIHVAGDLNASGGGSNPSSPYPQGPRYDNGTGNLITGGKDFSGGGFFTGYWLTTGAPTTGLDVTGDGKADLYIGDTSPFSNAIFAGGWYTLYHQVQHDFGYERRPCMPEPMHAERHHSRSR